MESMKSSDRHVVYMQNGDCYKLYTNKQGFLKKRTCAEHIADLPEEDEILAKKPHTDGKKNKLQIDVYLLPEGVLQKEEEINSSQNHEQSDVSYKSCKQT